MAADIVLSFEIVDPVSAEASVAMDSYFAELLARFDDGFDIDGALVADAPKFRPPNGRFVVARLDGSVVGSGALHVLEPGVVEVKRMWVASTMRGRGVGGRLLEHLERSAVEMGAERIRLDTNRVLVEAISMYRARGYHDIEAYNDNPDAHHWFEKPAPR